jgi:hypothetical protein
MRRVPPPRPTVFVLTPDTAGQRIGWTLEVTSTDGRVFEAVLIGVTEDVLQFEQRVGGGTVIFPIPKEEVVSMKELQ